MRKGKQYPQYAKLTDYGRQCNLRALTLKPLTAMAIDTTETGLPIASMQSTIKNFVKLKMPEAHFQTCKDYDTLYITRLK